MNNEIWRTVNVEGVPLAVSNTGRVKKILPRERELAPFKRPGSCAYVRIFHSGDKHCLRSVARLVAEAFFDAKYLPRNVTIGYRDGNVMNCSAENLIMPDHPAVLQPAATAAQQHASDHLQE